MEKKHEEMAKRLLSVLVAFVVLAGVLLSGCPEPVLPPSPKPKTKTVATEESEPEGTMDSDGDGLTNLQESEGWKVVIDMHGSVRTPWGTSLSHGP